MKNSIKSILSLIIILCCAPSFAQQEDFRTRYGVGASLEINDNWSGDLGLEQRFRNNASTKDRSLAQASLKYQGLKNLSIAAGYRLSYVYNRFEPNETKQRFNLDMAYAHKLARFKPSYRCRWQYGGGELSSSSETKHILRQRLQLSYSPFGLPIKPYLSFESFSQLNTSRQGLVDELRYTAGIDVQISQKLGVNCAFLRDSETNTKTTNTVNSLSISLNYKL